MYLLCILVYTAIVTESNKMLCYHDTIMRGIGASAVGKNWRETALTTRVLEIQITLVLPLKKEMEHVYE